jgi:hypothetical protein
VPTAPSMSCPIYSRASCVEHITMYLLLHGTVDLFERGNAFGHNTTEKHDLAFICMEELKPGSEKIGAKLMSWHSPPRDRHCRIITLQCGRGRGCALLFASAYHTPLAPPQPP